MNTTGCRGIRRRILAGHHRFVADGDDRRRKAGTAMALQSRTPGTKPRRRIDSSHYLYIAVIVAVLAGITVGLAAPEFAVGLKPIGDAFVLLIKMMIAPIIFCTIVLGRRIDREGGDRRQGRRPGAAVLHGHVDVRARHRPRRGQPHPPGRGPEHRRHLLRRGHDRGEDDERVHPRHHPDLAAVVARRRQHPAGAVRRPARRASRCRRWARRARRSSARSGRSRRSCSASSR